MNIENSHTKGYLLAAALGAFGGGVLVLIVTRALPKMMSAMMAGMMENMRSQMAASGCSPEET